MELLKSSHGVYLMYDIACLLDRHLKVLLSFRLLIKYWKFYRMKEGLIC